MPGSQFESKLEIIDGRISPAGELVLQPDEDVTKLYAWVMQVGESHGTGAVCIAFQESGGFPSRTQWTTRGDAIHEGTFRPGQAFAIAVTVSKVKAPDGAAGEEPSIYDVLGDQEIGSTRVYWWSETLLLVNAAAAEQPVTPGPAVA